MAERSELILGRHEAHFEEPDLLVIVTRGPLSAVEMNLLSDYIIDLAAPMEHLLVLADIRELGEIPPDSRRVLAVRTGPVPYRGIAIFGGSFQVRLLSKLLVGAVNLFSRPRRDNPVHFCDTEAEARAWIEQRRRVLA